MEKAKVELLKTRRLCLFSASRRVSFVEMLLASASIRRMGHICGRCTSYPVERRDRVENGFIIQQMRDVAVTVLLTRMVNKPTEATATSCGGADKVGEHHMTTVIRSGFP